MLIEESLRLNVSFNILENGKDCPCFPLAETFIDGRLTDAGKIKELATISDVLTFEIEHINTQALLELESMGKEIIPSPRVLQIIQDKGLQKEFYHTHNIPTAPFVLVENKEEWRAAIQKLGTPKIVAKTRRDGYDGKGVAICAASEILENSGSIPFEQPCVLEAFIPCKKELSVIVARDKNGQTLSYPSIEMEFDPEANLVTFLVSPAAISEELEQKAEQIALQAIAAMKGIGVFAVEMFLGFDDSILVNEVAPRPHNSGHHTIEACYTSQYESLTRILLGLPLGSTQLIKPAVMINLLGAKDFSGSYAIAGLDEAMKMDGVYVHLYAKKESKPMRKMGHVTILGDTAAEARHKAERVKDLLRFVRT